MVLPWFSAPGDLITCTLWQGPLCIKRLACNATTVGQSLLWHARQENENARALSEQEQL